MVVTRIGPDVARSNVARDFQHHNELLQQYRSQSVTAQSFILTVGSIVANVGAQTGLQRLVFLVILGIGLFHIWKVWVPIVRIRGHMVNFYKFQFEMDDDRFELLNHFGKGATAAAFAESKKLRKKLCDQVFQQDAEPRWPDTRYKMDHVVPWLFTWVWIALTALLFVDDLPGLIGKLRLLSA